MTPRQVSIVPHTHWDREWYEPFQSFRLRLVRMLDGLLALLEQDPSYARFLLDGQMAVVDDYLEVRPEAEQRLRALAASGRLSMGPWYVLMDEFLVSGETIIRDLQLGIQRGAAFGGVMNVGYLPDMFGHVAQMPQILRQAGFTHAVVWRGVPSSIDRSAFWWESPDGSTVRAEYLVVGYGNGAAIPDDAKALVRRIADHEQEIGGFLGDGGLLFMNGTDHQEPQPWLGRVVAEANELQGDYELQITSLADYLGDAPTEGLDTWHGELRSGARANVLMGVASNRVDVKQLAARTERALERRAEPYAALLGDAARWPTSLLGLAWREVVRNAAHDSICACSVDEVVDAVLHRYAEARRIADGLAEQVLAEFSRSLAHSGPVAVNASARPRSGVVEIVVVGDEVPPHTQALPEEPGAFGIPRGMGPLTLDAATVRTILGMLPSGSQIDTHTWIQDVRVEEDESGIDITIAFGSEERFDVPIASVKQDLYTRLGARPDSTVRIRIDQPPVRQVLARCATVAGYGWLPIEPLPLDHPVTVVEEPGGPVQMANGLTTVVVDSADGTFSLNEVAGFGRLVDGGDHGDSYNYSPPAQDRLVDTPDAVSVSVLEHGPVRASVAIVADYTWPEYVDGSTRARSGACTARVTTTLQLCAEDRHVSVTTTFVNPSRDHRLRVHLPLGHGADHSKAECAFAVVRRGLETEGRPDELGLPTFPSRRFVSAGRLTVVHEGLCEYELVDVADDGAGPKAGALAVTLLRATGMLSRLGMAYRPLPAGPITAVEGLQLQRRRIECRYALAVDCDDPYALVDAAMLPLDVVHGSGKGTRPGSGSALHVEGAEVSSVQRVAGMLEVRVFNPGPEPATVKIGDRSGWLVDLGGRALEPVDGAFALRPFGIATVRIPGA
ncbi:MAG TPA: glycoside hydrolase family 38 C-terminal domain-containing protein [Acidimicrobiales bacterium]|nr:glycoside hydrolase family 38 C-terminal domain-containing protein [Acidimicrobiales bacterium]